MSNHLMKTEAGGESTQYESIKTVTEPTAKSSGNFDSPQAEDGQTDASLKDTERGEKTASNIRYGQAISEQGFGGQTEGNQGSGNDAGYGRVAAEDADLKQTRREQGYGGGSGVGA